MIFKATTNLNHSRIFCSYTSAATGYKSKANNWQSLHQQRPGTTFSLQTSLLQEHTGSHEAVGCSSRGRGLHQGCSGGLCTVPPDVQKAAHPLPRGWETAVWRRARTLTAHGNSPTLHKASKKGDGLLSAPKNKCRSQVALQIRLSRLEASQSSLAAALLPSLAASCPFLAQPDAAAATLTGVQAPRALASTQQKREGG